MEREWRTEVWAADGCGAVIDYDWQASLIQEWCREGGSNYIPCCKGISC